MVHRWCIDFRSLNSVTVKDVFPLPLIEECIDTLSGTNFLSTLDMASGYWQIKLDEADRSKTAFITKYGLFEHTRMAFGLCNAPATFQRVIQLVLRGLTWKEVLAYLDDIMIVGSTFIRHLQNLCEVFRRFREHNLKLKPKKCQLFRKEVKFLGKIVSGQGIAVNPENVAAVLEWPIPKCTKDVEKFLGFVNYHREHIHEYAKRAEVLYGLTGKNPFAWERKHELAFADLQHALVTAPVLSYPNPKDLFILDTDASDQAIGAELVQVQEGKEKVIGYASFVLTPEQRRYCTTRKELLAVVRFTRHFRHYLLGRQFVVRTDHNSLVWLMRFKLIVGQLARWLEELSQYDMVIVHRPGKKHGNADGLSRITDSIELCSNYKAGVDLSSLPCKGCAYCSRAQREWARFEEDVDNVVPLSIRSLLANPEMTYWGPGFTKSQLRQAQLEDDDLRQIIAWKEDSVTPSESFLALSSPAVKYYWLQYKHLLMKDRVLFYKWESESREKLLLVVPASLREQVLQSCHDTKFAGHMGQNKTIARLKSTFIWYQMNKDSQNYVKSCSVCNLNKKACVKPKAPLGSYHAGAPMERVHIDILGPLQLSRSGNKYILMMVDQFTKWVECVPLQTQTAEVVAKACVTHFFSRFGAPLQLHTDQGKNFDSKLFKEICALMEITKTRTTAYRPCSNGQVERYNRTLLQMIRCFLQGYPNTWDENLPYLISAIRSTVHRQTNYTPNMMMLGREVTMPVEVMLGTAEVNHNDDQPASYVTQLGEVLQHCHKLAREYLQSSQVRQKRDYDLKLSVNRYQVGDLVYLIDSSTKIGQSSKLKPVWKGPMIVIEVITPSLYRVRSRRKDTVVHHDRMKLCNDRVIPIWVRRYLDQVNPEVAPGNEGDRSLDHSDSEIAPGSKEDRFFDQQNLLYDGSDLYLDQLFADLESEKSVENQIPAEDTNNDSMGIDNSVSINLAGNDEQVSDVSQGDEPVTVARSRRSRAVKSPAYLKDYVS